MCTEQHRLFTAGANVDQASLPSMGGILNSITLEDAFGVVSVEEGAPGGTLGVGSSARQSHDMFIALSEYGQVWFYSTWPFVPRYPSTQ